MVHELYYRVTVSSWEGLSLSFRIFHMTIKGEGCQVNWNQFLNHRIHFSISPNFGRQCGVKINSYTADFIFYPHFSSYYL